MTSGPERREYARYDVHGSATVFRGGDRPRHIRGHVPAETHGFRGRLVNIGLGGVELECHQVFDFGETLLLYFQPPSGPRVKCSAEVAWVERGYNTLFYGLEFTKIPERTRKRYARYITRYFGSRVTSKGRG